MGIKKDNKRKLQIANINHYQDETKRQTDEHPQRNKKISATIQNEEHTSHDMERDEENKHESEQERGQTATTEMLWYLNRKSKTAQLALVPIASEGK